MKEIFRKVIIQILKFESYLVLLKYKPRIIAITGSVGKTSTKDAVYTMLSKFAHVRKSEKSYNSQIGLPLTILGIPNGWNNPIIWVKNIFRGLWLIIYPHSYPKWLVLEVGVGKPGDMKETASWVKTDAVIITAIGETPVHIEFFDSRKALIEEKAGLIKTLKVGGLCVLNADDEAVLSMKEKSKSRVITYGFGERADVRASAENISYDKDGSPEGVVFRIDEGGASLPVEIDGVFGKNHVYAVLASLTLASGLKWNMLECINTIKHYDAPVGRMRLHKGIKNTLIIDDTYNSSPFACESALKTLGSMEKSSGRKIAVLGDMLELGRHTEEAHKNIGRVAKENANVLIVVGVRAKLMKEGAEEAGMKEGLKENEENIFEFDNSNEAGAFLKTFIKEGDIILIKGSQGMRMERAVEAILEDQANKHNLLVRQNKEWLEKK